ncbi:MAG: GntR family transcriptional regulator [Pseudorhodoplanes sp.]
MPALLHKIDYELFSPLPRQKRGNTVQEVQDLIRDAIVRMELPPGAFIDKIALCERLGVSRFPVSEALARLATEGLVEILPQRGTLVARIRLADVHESMFIRRALEAEAARTLAKRDAPALIAALQRNLRNLEDARLREDNDAFHAFDQEFHHLLIDAVGFERVKLAVEASRATLDRVRIALCSPKRKRVTIAEYQAIVAALIARDAAAAGRAMETHLDAVLTTLLALAASYPDAFEGQDGK